MSDFRFVDEGSARQGSRKEFLKSLRKPRPINNARLHTCARSRSKLGSADKRGRSASSRVVKRRTMPRKQPFDRMETRYKSNEISLRSRLLPFSRTVVRGR